VYFETSALSGQGVNAAANKLVSDIMGKVEAAAKEDFLPAK